MGFKNDAQLQKFLLSKSKIAIAKAQDKVYQILDKFLQDFYKDYEPGVTVEWDGRVKVSPYAYQRTEQLLHSLVKTNVVQSKNGLEARVYFDYESLNYLDGNRPTGLQVMEAAAQGFHGAIGDDFQYMHGKTGVSIWNDPKEILDVQAVKILKDMLVAEGIPLK